MEDALVPESSSSIQNARATSLNPCFNGRCTRTYTGMIKKKFGSVLILVLMEDALVQQNLGYALFKRIVRLDCAS